MAGRGPTIVRVHNSGGGGYAPTGGVKCCFCQCCTCVHVEFLRTEPGLLKIAEVILSSMCQSLALNYGIQYASNMGAAYYGFLTTASWCLMTTFILLFCYVISIKSFSLIRQSLFETAFNAVAAFCYLSSSSYLAFAVKTFLYPLYIITPFFQVYPAMSAAYTMGTILGILHGYDAFKSFRFYKGFR